MATTPKRSFRFVFTADGGAMPGTPTLTIAGKEQELEALDGRPSGAKSVLGEHENE